MKRTVACLLLLSVAVCSPAGESQQPNTSRPNDVTDIQEAGGFLRVCGSDNPSLADSIICLTYMTGVIDGWREGHDQGVMTAAFPNGVPRDLSGALKSMSQADLARTRKQLNNGALCIPEHMSIGGVERVVLDYFRAKKVVFGKSSRLIAWALADSFPCPSAGDPPFSNRHEP